MIDIEILRVFLPKFLSSIEEAELYEGLKQFPDKYDKFYTTYIPVPYTLFQGDAIQNLPICKFSRHMVPIWKTCTCILLSNTCDMDTNNDRKYSTNMIYAPILSLKKFVDSVLSKKYDGQTVISMVENIKKQRCTQILYLPSFGSIEESIVFLDRVQHVPLSYVDRNDLPASRVFTLSTFGTYLLLLKLSIHYTRMKDSFGKWAPGVD